jgi:telomerase protein component 1
MNLESKYKSSFVNSASSKASTLLTSSNLNKPNLTSSLLTTTFKPLTSSLLDGTNFKSLSLNENDKKKKLEPVGETEAKKPKLTQNLANSSLLNTSLLSKKSNDIIKNLQTTFTASTNNHLKIYNSTNILNNIFSKKPDKLRTENKTIPLSSGNKRSYAHSKSDSSLDENDSINYIKQEYLKTEQLILEIEKEHRASEENFKKAKKLKLNNFNRVFHEQKDAKNKIDLKSLKKILINTVSSSLLRQPNFKNIDDPTRKIIFNLSQEIIVSDPEFILKLALYTRQELNIRETANYLLSIAAFKQECRLYLHRYYNKSIVLPSDWISVAEQYQLFMDKKINYGALPSSLRKCMMNKFSEFDQYQLAKYNKEKSRMAKNKKLKDVKHFKARIRDNDGNLSLDGKSIVEQRFVKTLKHGLKINDRICFEVMVNENCQNLKIDILNRNEPTQNLKLNASKSRRGNILAQKKIANAEEIIAIRINVDYTNRRITQKSFVNKTWSKRAENVNNPQKFNFKNNAQNQTRFYIDVKSKEFIFGLVESGNNYIELSRYLHSKHNIELFKLNNIRFSGVSIKLKDLVIKSTETVHFDTQNSEDLNEKETKQRNYTIKQLIRQLHIFKPVDNVMCLLGKKYPLTFEEFIQSKLPGVFNSDRAGKRMKLPTPETWETQISMKGNKASVWEQLIDNKKLPYMAMLRNLRNMIKCGISNKHHEWVLKKLCDEGAVIHSRQFPFRFFTAYEVLDELLEEMNEYLKWCANSQIEPKKKNSKNVKDKTKTRTKYKDMLYDEDLLKKYKTALDNALKVATTYNISPIKGSTCIFLNMSSSMNFYLNNNPNAKSLGKKVNTIADLAALLALMFKYSCEYSKLFVLTDDLVYSNVELEQGTILDNMKSLTDIRTANLSENSKIRGDTRSLLKEILHNEEHFDNLILLSNGVQHIDFYKDFLKKYRSNINDSLLFVNVNLSISDCNIINDINFNHEMDVCISGFSDSILRFVAERGNQGQLIHIENIDKSYDLTEIKQNNHNIIQKQIIQQVERPKLKINIPIDQWKTVKVFISSTFLDMHAERDILTKTIFPMLRAKLSHLMINIYDIDLRWGIADEKYKETLDICLNQVLESDYFISILGERYGNSLESYEVSKNERLNWLINYPPNASITELEIECQLRKNEKLTDEKKFEKTFFYFRDKNFLDNVPDEFKSYFITFNKDEKFKLKSLKNRIKSTSYEIYDGYKCEWYKMDEIGRALVYNLDDFAHRVFNNLFNSIKNKYENNVTVEVNELLHLTMLNDAYIKLCADDFVARDKLIEKFEILLNSQKIIEIKSSTTEKSKDLIQKQNSLVNIILVNGVLGSGKTSFLAKFITNYANSYFGHSFKHFVGAYDGSEYTKLILKRFCNHICLTYNLYDDDLLKKSSLIDSDDYNYLRKTFFSLLNKLDEVVKLSNQKFFIIIDGVDNLLDENNIKDEAFDWLPDNIPSNISLIFSARTESKMNSILNKIANKTNDSRIKLDLFDVENLNVLDKAELIRLQLGKYNKYLDESAFSNQMKLLTNKRDSTSPFFLTLLCEELRLHNQYETLNSKLKELPIKINLLIEYMLNRLETHFGSQFTRAAITFICSSRDGLTDQELQDLLTFNLFIDELNLFDQIEKADSIFSLVNQNSFKLAFLNKFELFKIPTAKFLSFIDSIKVFIKPRSQNGLIVLKSNNFITNSLKSKYGDKLTSSISKNSTSVLFSSKIANKIMSIYYWSLIDKNFDLKFQNDQYQRAYVYLPFHLSMSNLYTDLAFLLCDLRFLAIKCQQNLVKQLMDDFDFHQNARNRNILINLLSKSSAKLTTLSSNIKLNDYKTFISTNYHILITNPTLIYQQAMNQPETSHPFIDLKYLLKHNQDISGGFLFEWLRKPNTNSDQSFLPVKITDFNYQSVCCVAISPNGQFVACGTDNCEIKLFSLSTANLIRTYQGHSGRINQLCFINRSNMLASASSDGLASLWDLNSGFRFKILNKHNDHVVSGCCAEPNGKSLITVGWDCSVKIWNTSDGSLVGDLKGHTRPINCVTFSTNDDNLIATGCWDSAIRIYNLVSRSRKAVLRGHKTSVRSISYSYDSTFIASSSLDGQIKLWNSKTGSQLASLSVNDKTVNSVCFSPSSQFLVTCSNDRTIKCWSGVVGKSIMVIKENDDDKKLITTSVCFDQRTGSRFAVGYNNGDLKIFDTVVGNIKSSIKAHTSSIRKIKFSKYGNHLIATSENGSVKLFDTLLTNEISESIELIGNHSPVNALAINADNVIITGSDECVLNVYTNVISFLIENNQNESEDMDILDLFSNYSSSSSKKKVDYKKLEKKSKLTPNHTLLTHKSPITGCSFNKSGDKFVSASKDATIIVWRLDFNYEMCDINELYKINQAHFDWITDIEWSNSSDYFITSSNDFTLKIFNSKDGKVKSILSGHKANINSCSFQYGCIVSTSSDGTVKIWSHKGHEITTLKGHQNRVNGCDLFVKLKQKESISKISNNNNRTDEKIDEDNQQTSWSEKVQEKEWIDKHNSSSINKDNFIIDDVYLVTVADDSTIRLWKPIESDYLVSLEGHNDKINSVSLSKDGMLASASADANVNLWNLKPFFNKISSGQLNDNSLKHKNHNSKVTSLAIDKKSMILFSGSHDGQLIIWQLDYEHDYLTGISYKYDIKAHENSCNSICILEEKNDKIIFATSSSDKTIKIWSFKQNSTDIQVELIQNIDKTKENVNVLFIEKLNNCNYMLSVEYQMNTSYKDILLIRFYTIESKNKFIVKMESKFTCRLDDDSLINSSIKIISDSLYITLLRNEIIKLNIDKILKSSRPVFIDLKSIPEQHFEIIEILRSDNDTNPEPQNKWYSAIDKSECGELAIGDCKGNLNIIKGKDNNADHFNSLHQSSITELFFFKTNQNKERLVTSSQDGNLKVWSESGNLQLGHYYTGNAISKLKLITFDQNSRLYFILGDQMGNINLVRWYDD